MITFIFYYFLVHDKQKTKILMYISSKFSYPDPHFIFHIITMTMFRHETPSAICVAGRDRLSLYSHGMGCGGWEKFGDA